MASPFTLTSPALFCNRSAVKLAEIDSVMMQFFNLLPRKQLVFIDICGGPRICCTVGLIRNSEIPNT
jgi:hypothetical protein